ncbi:chaperonin 10-like protein [Plectosphaerella cucumerina]|uniref:Chaperonin 10-like protein n=1 Tax=Plectosphaerella cucumerina TaxID=40658 RepID=A0A8K0T7X2_9PEZI|nr:chaperonin 10-like protein [Plectosphaerella cucumerina]
MTTHLAAVSLSKGSPFEVQTRSTPQPGSGELLIAVKSIALNPADVLIRQLGLFIASYPAVTGFDISGLVLAVGDGVPTSATAAGSGPFFEPGVTRVAAYAAGPLKGCSPDYGAFQKRCLVPWQHAAPLPAEGISWKHAATLPVSIQVPLSAWDAMGLPRLGQTIAASSAKEALLIWGASSSVGTMGVQTARLLKDEADSAFVSVYAVAGKANHDYVSSLGADRVFDHKDPRVVEAIIAAAREDGLLIRHCFLAAGHLAPCQDVLKAFVGEGSGEKAKIASAPVVPADAAVVDGVETIFVMPASDEGERLAQFEYWMGTFLRENLAKGAIRPSPEPKIVGKGVGAINAGMDLLAQGVSCVKLVIEIDE